jgi:hypothetical protein
MVEHAALAWMKIELKKSFTQVSLFGDINLSLVLTFLRELRHMPRNIGEKSRAARMMRT